MKIVQEFLNIDDVSTIESFALYPCYPFNEQSSEWDYIVTYIKNRKTGILTDTLTIEISPNQDTVMISYSPEFAEKEICKASSTFLSSFTEVYSSSKESQIYFLKDYIKGLGISSELSNFTVEKHATNYPFNDKISEWDYIINFAILEKNEKVPPYYVEITDNGTDVSFNIQYPENFSETEDAYIQKFLNYPHQKLNP